METWETLVTSPELSIISARPRIMAALVTQTGLNEEALRELVHQFYGKVRQDRLLAPTFEERISNWSRHLERMVAFWSSVAMMTGRYHGRPVPVHAPLKPRPFVIGIGFDAARLSTIYPQPHDIGLDMILTEAGVRAQRDIT